MKQSGISRATVAAAVAVAGLGLAASAGAQDVNVDYDRKADFSKCATYAWVPGQPAPNPLVDRRIVDAIDGALAAKGWKKVEASPGCFVTYQASVKEQKSLQVRQPGGWRFAGGMGSVDVKSILSGMLVVDIGDAAAKELMWRGVARDTISDKPEKNEKKLAKVVAKMFKGLPSASAKP